MSRLDRHVAAVQNKLALTRFIESLALAAAVVAGAVLATILTQKLFQVGTPQPWYWLAGAAGVGALTALIVALVRRPTSHDAAVAIDQHLGLKEKFSTALLIRSNSDPFAQAAVKDAEVTAERVAVDFYKHFP